MPVVVSPILMVEVSMAAINVSWRFGFRAIGMGFSWRLVGVCSDGLNWYIVCELS